MHDVCPSFYKRKIFQDSQAIVSNEHRFPRRIRFADNHRKIALPELRPTTALLKNSVDDIMSETASERSQVSHNT
eukprot:c14112_g1_i1 orf=201-425(-)